MRLLEKAEETLRLPFFKTRKKPERRKKMGMDNKKKVFVNQFQDMCARFGTINKEMFDKALVFGHRGYAAAGTDPIIDADVNEPPENPEDPLVVHIDPADIEKVVEFIGAVNALADTNGYDKAIARLRNDL